MELENQRKWEFWAPFVLLSLKDRFIELLDFLRLLRFRNSRNRWVAILDETIVCARCNQYNFPLERWNKWSCWILVAKWFIVFLINKIILSKWLQFCFTRWGFSSSETSFFVSPMSSNNLDYLCKSAQHHLADIEFISEIIYTIIRKTIQWTLSLSLFRLSGPKKLFDLEREIEKAR